jgi:pimeloyl-ACP methyl ester carboxylesterase
MFICQLARSLRQTPVRRSAICCIAFGFFASIASAQTPSKQTAEDPVESWVGTLDVGPMKLRLRLDVQRDENGQLAGTLISVDQGNASIPLDAISVSDQEMSFESKMLKASYTGTLNEAADEVTGTFTQLGRDLPLTLKTGVDLAELEPERPQHPKEPFPYKTEDVTFENENAEKVTLAGTLTLPDGQGPFPAVVLVTGSGPQDRDESLMGHKPFLVIADHLTRNGIAVLRFDDRGFGKSTGSFLTATTADFAADTEAGIKYLAGRDEIDENRIGVIGHSEGGVVAGMLAANGNQLAHVVMLAGTGIPGKEVVRSQTKKMYELRGGDGNEAALIGKVVDAVAEDATVDDVMAIADAHFAEMNGGDSDGDEEQRKGRAQLLKAAVGQFATPGLRFFIKHDPTPDLRNAKIPVFALNGAKDRQVLADLNLTAVEEALAQSGTEGHRCERLEGLNHLFQTAETGLPEEYATITETMSPKVLEMLTEWVNEH